MSAYYNENDPFAAAWLRELIKSGEIADGEVDTRSITEVAPEDLRGFNQAHFFAGIGGWAYALRLAGWPDDRPVWTGSCPCQPFSNAGRQEGKKDKRHLWPIWFRLIRECAPPIIFGEQVAKAIAHGWLDEVATDLETENYAIGSDVLSACSVTAPQERERVYFVAYSDHIERPWERPGAEEYDIAVGDKELLADTNGGHEHWWSGPLQVGWNAIEGEITRGGRKYRAQWPIKPGLSLLAYGIPNRVGRLRGYGNAIVPQVAAEFIKAFIETQEN